MAHISLSDVFFACGLIIAAFIVHLIYKGVYSAYIGPLRKVPGPKLAAMTTLVFMIKGAQGIKWKWMQKELIPKYGKILRLAPDIVLVSDRDEVKRILVNEDWRKSELMAGLRSAPNTATLFNATDKDYHKNRRRMLSHAFSIKFLNSLEPLMGEVIVDLLNTIRHTIRIQGHAKGGIVNIAQLVTFLTLDIIGTTAFGGSFEMVKTGYHPFPDNIAHEQQVRLVRAFCPPLKHVVPLPTHNYEFVTNIIRKRRQLEGPPPKDLLQLLLNAYDEENSPLTDQAIYDQLLELLAGGSDTIAFTIIVTLIHLSKNPAKMELLVKELDEACEGLGNNELPTHSKLKDLPYLNACINESLRLWPPAPEIPSPRVSEKDVMVCGHWFPKGTTFFTNFYSLHHAAEYWGPDVEEYKPERWLEGGHVPQDAFYPFSAGSRDCIGAKFAWMEMRIVLATLFTKFNFKDIPGQRHDDIVQFVLPRFKNDTYNLSVSPRT